ncbi:MAG: TrkA C-terminal domain-containing protein [Clostridiaceae bacterium]
MEKKVVTPVYQQIAIDIASRIAKKDIPVGYKLKGRSILAGEYNVSPETIRRSMHLLEDVGIVQVSAGSGITVTSLEAANDYIKKFTELESLSSKQQTIKKLIHEKQKLDKSLEEAISSLMDYSERFKHTNPFTPIEYELEEDCPLIGETIGSSQFWQNTGGTIVGIKRKDTLIISPGPYADFRANDTLIIIGDINIYERVEHFCK